MLRGVFDAQVSPVAARVVNYLLGCSPSVLVRQELTVESQATHCGTLVYFFPLPLDGCLAQSFLYSCIPRLEETESIYRFHAVPGSPTALRAKEFQSWVLLVAARAIDYLPDCSTRAHARTLFCFIYTPLDKYVARFFLLVSCEPLPKNNLGVLRRCTSLLAGVVDYVHECSAQVLSLQNLLHVVLRNFLM